MPNYTKKEPTKQTEVKAEIEETKEVVEKQAEKKMSVPKTPRKFALDELILCRSVTGGELLLPSKKTGMLYIWSNFGDTCEVEFQDLQALRSTRSPYLRQPLFIIENDELVEQWASDLLPIYSKFSGVDDIDSFFELPLEEFKNKIGTLPVGLQNAVKVFAVEKIQNGTLDSLNKIQVLDEVLGTDLKSYLK